MNKLLVLAFALLLLNCTRCPPDFKLGDVKMLNPLFLPLKGGEQLTYKNAKGDVLILKDSSEKQYENKIIVETLCQKKPFSIQFSYYEGTPRYNLRYVNTVENLKFYFQLSTINTQTEKDTVLYDVLNIDYKLNGSSNLNNNLYILISDRGNGLKIPDFTKNRSVKLADTLINAISYKNAFYNNQNKKMVYVANIGLVSFWHKNEWWFLNEKN
jgi:hypothetical protein